MSDLASLRAILKSEVKSNSPYVDAAIYTALTKLRSEPLYINMAKWNFYTEASEKRYPLPKDYVSIRGRVYCTPSGSDERSNYELLPKTVDELEDMKYSSLDFDSFVYEGNPRHYGVDYSGKEFVLFPIPSITGDNIFFRYTKDLGTPKLSVSITSSTPPSNTATMTLLSPDGGTLESTFTNAWFTEAFDLVRAFALYNLWTRWHGGSDSSANKAKDALIQFLDEMNRIRGESAIRQSVHSIRRYL